MRLSLVLMMLAILSCNQSKPGDPTPSDVAADTAFGDTKDVGEDTYEQDCVVIEMWFCPDAAEEVLAKTVRIDRCAEPPVILNEGECVPYFECDPAFTTPWYEGCTTEEGKLGQQLRWCAKGIIKSNECIACSPEICNGLDDDCDEVIDNLPPTDCASDCGPGLLFCVEGEEVCVAPEGQEEVCNYIDDDCDGLTDEGQTNACGTCGLLSETCNGIDDDCNGETDEDLYQDCLTQCGKGFETCIDGKYQACTAKEPAEEICNGFDDDCDNFVDEGLNCLCTEEQVGTFYPCQEPPLLCGQGLKQCICANEDCSETAVTQCHASCFYFPIPGEECENKGIVVPEVCNNYDDNCNELIDEDLHMPCYTGPEGTANVGICTPGVQVCEAGQWGSGDPFVPNTCAGEQTPLDQDLCNGADDNCDGTIDDGEEMHETDILFIIDYSGSMSQEISAVLVALTQFAQNYNDEEKLQWGAIGVAVGFNFFNERLEVISNLSPFPDFISNFGSFTPAQMGGNEMTIDALWIALDQDVSGKEWKTGESVPPLQDISLNWRDGVDRLIIVWSDEGPQSYLDESIPYDDLVTVVTAAPNLYLYVFSNAFGKTKWENLAAAGNGGWFNLTQDPTVMYNSLLTILDEAVCK